MVAVIAHGEILSWRNHNFAVVNVLKNFVRPFGLHVGLEVFRTVRREIVPERIVGRGRVTDDIRLTGPLPVDIYHLIENLDAVAGNSNHALDVMRVILKRKFKNNDVPAADFAIRKKMVVPMSAPAENKFIHEEVIADQKGGLHGLRRNLERLHDKRGAK